MRAKLKHVQRWSKLAPKANWSAVKLSQLSGMHVRTLERHFLKHMGETPKSWLTKQRQTWAKKQLSRGCSVKEAAQRSGYSHASTFSREFRKHWGKPPVRMIVA